MNSGPPDPGLALRYPPRLSEWLEAGPVALFLDFDGTLVDLAPGPDRIAPRERLGDALAALGERLGGRCAVVSGRAIADIEKHIGALPVAAAGSHGSDIRTADGRMLGSGPAGLPEAISSALRGFASREGLDYEDKPHGGALHYRASPERGEAAHAFAKGLADEHGWMVQGGKNVVELVSRGASKGAAVDALMATEPFAGACPLFIGDDLTDEAGFEACLALGGTAIIVGDRKPTAAAYRLPDVTTVHDWLCL